MRTVTTWYLEQTAPGDLRAAEGPDPSAGVRIMRAQVPSAEFSRFLYASVGADVEWTDRLPWPRAQWQEWLERPGAETWVAYEKGTPAGFIELDGASQDTSARATRPGQTVEISYFGLLPAFRGRRIGAHLLEFGAARAWDMAERWPDREPTNRVWVHTCSKDGPHALGNYQRRGFRIFAKEVTREPAPAVEQGPAPAAPLVPRPDRREPSQGSRPADM
ncbi:GNAT family N-acetyltransferase [Streptomyces sp. WMMB 714]|uniref:GNAT family N-acetyltransferase n=1 Tax=Streptomyces sp. WMMB 714 TaxID=1286822 RepID=UPI00099B6309|nr:GNAT family N-acetyltransferase [Streptomyces sp. WMMB 714]